MSEVSTFSARLDLDSSSESFVSLYQRVTGKAATAGSSAKRWLDQTVTELNARHQLDGPSMNALAAEPLALASLCSVLDIPQHAPAVDVGRAIAGRTPEGQRRLVDTAIDQARTAQRGLIQEAVTASLLSLGYRARRTGSAASTFAHVDGTSARVEIKQAGAKVGVNLDLGGFSDGRCRQVRAQLVEKLKRRGIVLRTIVRDDVPLDAYNSCVRGRGAGARRLR